MRKGIIGFVVGVVLATTGAAVASIPDSSGVIHGCYKTAAPHALRVVDRTPRIVNGRKVVEVCLSDETPLSWDSD